MPKRRYVKCQSCGHVFSSGSPNPTCSACKNKNCADMTEQELKTALDNGTISRSKITKNVLEAIDGKPQGGSGEKRVIGAPKGVTLDPATQLLFEYETKHGRGKQPLSEWFNDTVQKYYRDKGIEPALMIGDVSGKQWNMPVGPGGQRPADSMEELQRQMDEIRKQRILRLQLKELDNMGRESDIELKEREQALMGKKKDDHDDDINDMDFERMMAMDMKRQTFEQMQEEKRMRLERQALELEKKKAEIEKMRRQGDITKGKFDEWGNPIRQQGGGSYQDMLMQQQMQMQMMMFQTMLENQKNNNNQNASPEQMRIMLEQSMEKYRQERTLDEFRRESMERERRYQEQMAQLSSDKQNMVLNELIRRQKEVEARASGYDRLDLLQGIKRDLPWLFGGGGENFNPDKKQLEMQEQMMERGLDTAEKIADRFGKGMDRLGNMGEKIVESSLKRAEQQEYRDYSDSDMEEMYNKLREGDDGSFYGPEEQGPQPQPVSGRDVADADYDPEDFYESSEQMSSPPPAQPRPQPQPQEQYYDTQPPPQEPKKKKDISMGLTAGY